MKAIFNPYDQCPCESGKKAKFCCLNGRLWNKKPSLLKADTAVNFSNDKCYARKTNRCSSKISKEHYISDNILKGLELNKKVKIIGLPWQESKTFSLLPRGSLVANILCQTHNSLLSPFDAEMGRLYDIILRFDENFNSDKPVNDVAVFCGEDLERWMLKTACAFIASNQICIDGARKEILLKDEYVDILYNNMPFPNGWGMYFKAPENGQIQKYNSISFRSLTAGNELKGAEFLINNFMFYLLLGTPDSLESFGIYRPRGMQLAQGQIKKRIEICWQDKKYNAGIFMERNGTRAGEPEEWDDYLKK